ncbi:TauD/TfdA dioxygenase family protein [Muricoccus radiodurans]|uniref:TauD/TfdA dioxygenase family protein n=1 Tax=Muricoccus radiodurans TaxID=2231721 RepID=UPI003CE6769A
MSAMISSPHRQPIEVRPLNPTIGAELHGLDLSQPLDGEAVEAVRDALHRYKVVFFRDQRLTPEQHLDFARRFGSIEVNPIFGHVPGQPEIMLLVKEKEDRHNIGEIWHSDMSFAPVPPMGSILLARQVPPAGGDTLWCDMHRAYETLSDGLKAVLRGLRAVHNNRGQLERAAARANETSTEVRPTAFAKVREAIHPVVRVHEGSGLPCLFVSDAFTWCFEGWTREESLPLLRMLLDHATRPENVVRFRWAEGSIAFWDNRSTMHYAANDYHGHRREMHRITVNGTPAA